MTDKKIVINCETGEVQELELTSADIAQREADAIASAAKDAADKEEAKTKADVKAAIAKRLGLTVDDLATLLG